MEEVCNEWCQCGKQKNYGEAGPNSKYPGRKFCSCPDRDCKEKNKFRWRTGNTPPQPKRLKTTTQNLMNSYPDGSSLYQENANALTTNPFIPVRQTSSIDVLVDSITKLVEQLAQQNNYVNNVIMKHGVDINSIRASLAAHGDRLDVLDSIVSPPEEMPKPATPIFK